MLETSLWLQRITFDRDDDGDCSDDAPDRGLWRFYADGNGVADTSDAPADRFRP